MRLTFDEFKDYLDEIEKSIESQCDKACARPDLTKSAIELLSVAMDDTQGYILNWIYTLDFGKANRYQLMLGKNGRAIPMESVEALWNLLNSEVS